MHQGFDKLSPSGMDRSPMSPFALSLSKGWSHMHQGFDKLSQNGKERSPMSRSP